MKKRSDSKTDPREKNRRRILAVLMLMTALLCLSACGQAASEQDEAKAPAAQVQAEKVGPDADEYYAELEDCRKQIEEITDFKPEIVLVLGTGLNDYADKLDTAATIPYSDIEGWPKSTVSGHKGNLIFAEYQGLKLAIMQGRVHYYEGYPMDEVVKPLRVLHMLGADTVILTNAVGAINKDYKVGEFVCVKDHISSFVPSPLIGENIEELGERFTPMDDVYDETIQKAVLQIGKEKKIPVHSGVFVQTTGPQFETPAEIKMFRKMGADTVGMSTAVEAIAAAHMGMKVCDINSITNMAAGIEEFDQESIDTAAEESGRNFETLIDSLLQSIAEERKK